MDKHKFSERERQVIVLLLQGKSNKQIAFALGVSTRTAEFHLSNIYAKLKVLSRTEAVLKLSDNSLWESTGLPVRESTVEKSSELVENIDNLVRLRRQKMKNVFYILTSGTLIMIIVGFGLITRAKSNNYAFTDQTSAGPTFELAVVTETVPVVTTSVPPTIPLPLSYEVLAPAKIKKDNITFEVLAELITCGEVKLEVVGTFPLDFPSSYPESNYASLFTEVELLSPSSDISLELDPSFGGGGGADVNGLHIRGQGFAYFINPSLTINQKFHITMLIRFNEFFGISESVPFDLELIPQECP